MVHLSHLNQYWQFCASEEWTFYIVWFWYIRDAATHFPTKSIHPARNIHSKLNFGGSRSEDLLHLKFRTVGVICSKLHFIVPPTPPQIFHLKCSCFLWSPPDVTLMMMLHLKGLSKKLLSLKSHILDSLAHFGPMGA